MKFKTLYKELIPAVEKVSKIIPSKATLQAITGINIKTEKGKVYFRGTNLDFSIEANIVADIKQEGEVSVPASVFLRTVKILRKPEKINIYTQDSKLIIESDTENLSINTIDHSDFPIIPKPENASEFEIDPKQLIKGFSSVTHSASLSSIKPELSSVYVYSDTDLVFVATDQFRLAEKRINTTVSDFPPTIIPIQNVNEFIYLLSGEEDKITVFVDEDQISFKSPKWYATSRIVNGSFPDYKNIIPGEFVAKVTLLKEDFANSIQKASIFSDKFGKTKLIVNPGENKFTIEAQNSDIGSVSDTPPATVEGENVEMSFNFKYLKDTIASIETDSIILSFAQKHQPLVIKGVSDNSYTYIVMPMNQ